MRRYAISESRAGIVRHIRIVTDLTPVSSNHYNVFPTTLCMAPVFRDLFIRSDFDPKRATCAHCIAVHHQENPPS